MDLKDAIILGLIEGITEYLPVSSTGHLIIANSILKQNDEIYKVYDIFIQLGAILAVVIYYRRRFLGFIKRDPMQEFSGLKGILLLGLTTFPALVLGFLFHSTIKSYLFYPGPVSWALFAGGLGLLWIESRKPQVYLQDLNAMTWDRALLIGLFQCLALWPGFSRSAATIIGGVWLGLKRKHAAEYSFLAAVPVITAAVAYDLYKSWDMVLTGPMDIFMAGFLVAFVTAVIAIRSFLAFLNLWGMNVFAYYRIVLAVVVLWWMA